MSDVVNTAFYLPFGKRAFGPAVAEATLVQDLLCYDRVWIVTDHMAAVSSLAAMMGTGAFERAVADGTIAFIHDRTMFGWPRRPGLSPVVSIGSAANEDGFSQRTAADLAYVVLDGFSLTPQDGRRVAELVERATVDLWSGRWKSPPDASSVEENFLRDLSLYKAAVLRMQDPPVTLGDLNRLERDLRKPNKAVVRPGRSTTFDVPRISTAPGWKALDETTPIPRKQLGLLNLVLSDRFLAAQATVTGPSTLHTEPSVEAILAGRLFAVRSAAGGEVDDLLAEYSIAMPLLVASGMFPYDRLLDARRTAAAAAFRDVVNARDVSHDTILQAFLASLSREIANRISMKACRVLAAGAIGLATGGAQGAAAAGIGYDIVDSFLVEHLLSRRTARYFIDDTLRTLVGEERRAT